MPFYLRRSITVGPFRFNLSKSGVGLSTGVKGLRIGTGPRGHYIHAGAGGLYYRSTLGGNAKKKGPPSHKNSLTPNKCSQPLAPTQDARAPSYVTDEGVVMSRIVSADAEVMHVETQADAVADLNEAQGRAPLALLVGGAGATVSSLIATSFSASILAASLMLSVMAALIALRVDQSRRQVVFAYDLDAVAERQYTKLVDALDGIGAAHGLWYIEAAGNITDIGSWKRHAGASELIDKHETKISYDLPPGVQSNITPPSVRIARQVIYFMPDCLLVRESRRYGAVAYRDLRVGVRDQRFIVDDTPPSDALIVGETWAHPNKSGGPDRRFKNNRKLPICLFEEIGIIGSTGLKVLLQISRRGTALPAAQALEGLGKISKDDKPHGLVLLNREV